MNPPTRPLVRPRVDWDFLAARTRLRMQTSGLSFRAAADECGVSPIALCRVANGQAGLSADGLACLLTWLDGRPHWATTRPPGQIAATYSGRTG